jgi:TonB family protein
VNEAVDRLIRERERLDRGLQGSVLVSVVAHVTLVGLVFAAPLLLPREPMLRVADGFAVVLPRGGGGSPGAAPAPAPAAPVAPPTVLKPPTESPRPRAIPPPDSRRTAKRAPEPATTSAAKPGARAASLPAGTPKGAGTGAATPGLEFGPPGPGVPDGTDAGGDWYLAGVQQKIWMLWNQQIKAGFTQPIGVTFTILADGSVTDVRVTQPSGATLLDMAAQRAIQNAAPFGPLPREYGTNHRIIQALFKPTS